MVTSIKGNATSTFGGNIDVTGNVVTDAPAFRAYLGTTQVISTATFTKLQINTKVFDTTSDYDNATNYRYTPSVAGYYQVSVTSLIQSIADGKYSLVTIYKNGTEINRGTQTFNGIQGDITSNAVALLYMNGSTDYLEFYVAHNHGADRNALGLEFVNNASAVLVRSV